MSLARLSQAWHRRTDMQHGTRLATAPDRPTRQVSPSHDAGLGLAEIG
jgi:hypothetical protein